MSLIEHAKKEMDLAWPASDDMQDMVKKNILELMEVFSNQGHSGFSAHYVLGVFDKLIRFEPLTPLTGADEEWMEIGDNLYQNIRFSSIFKEGVNGEAYWIDGKVFRDKNGCCYTNRNSRVPVTFPWTKTNPEYIDVEE